DAERRWSYTVFLTTLARYLDLKAELGELDARYGYAQAALVHYAEWMARREAPYLDHPEELEYPTETWAAQDLRKANVLRLAPRHDAEPLRSHFLARGQELADRVWDDLAKFASRDVARCLAILLPEGHRDVYFRSHLITPAPRASKTNDIGLPSTFVSQKHRI